MNVVSADASHLKPYKSNLESLKILTDEAGRFERPVVQTPSMINFQEQRFLYLLASEYFQSRGDIIDAGIFLGASTNCLAAGLRANPVYSYIDSPCITAFDLCQCDDFMAQLINDLYKTELQQGHSFHEILQANLTGCAGDIDLKIGDIKKYHATENIEILFLDICKDPEINRHVVSSFFPKLIPGISVVIHQDFVHESLPWIHVSMGLLADFFEFVGVIGEFGPSAVYLCTKTIPPSVGDIYSYGSLPVLEAAFETAVSKLDDVQRYFVAMAYTRLLAGRGLIKEALTELDRLDDLYDPFRQRCAYLPTTAKHRSRLGSSWATVR